MIAAPPLELVSPAAMARIDAAAIASGIPGARLMAAAGRAVAGAIRRRFAPQPVLVLCGPGNNGGDGFVVARLLHEAGWPVRIAASRPRDAYAGDAAAAAAAWSGPVEPLGPARPTAQELVVDALFGAGLTRPLAAADAAPLQAAAAAGLPIVAVDMPSGVDGATGAVLGYAPLARLTVTFVRLKPGHILLPGRLHCGELELADIGVPDGCVAAADEGVRLDRPPLWRHCLPRRGPADHKYRFGHLLLRGGPLPRTGAIRLAALAALRAGAGLVTVACDAAALSLYAAAEPTLMTRVAGGAPELQALLAQGRFDALLIGPGRGLGPQTRHEVLALLAAGRPTVLDADALSAFARDPGELLAALHADTVLTPHDGEFARLFALQGDRLTRARAAAAAAGCIVLLKGADSVVAAPDGRAAILDHAPPALATAGTGDVLAGTIAALLAQRMPAFEAAAAAAWLHGEAAHRAGARLIASDLPGQLGAALDAAAAAPDSAPADDDGVRAVLFSAGGSS